MCDECKVEPWTHVYTDRSGRKRYLCSDCYAQVAAPLPPRGHPGDMSAPRPPTPLKGDHGWTV
jgi:hypothetical protein